MTIDANKLTERLAENPEIASTVDAYFQLLKLAEELDDWQFKNLETGGGSAVGLWNLGDLERAAEVENPTCIGLVPTADGSYYVIPFTPNPVAVESSGGSDHEGMSVRYELVPFDPDGNIDTEYQNASEAIERVRHHCETLG